jgi:antitoxin ParD1/3/4
MSMQTMNISLPDPMKAFVDGQISTGRYSSVSEYMRELIREDEKRKAQDQLEALLLDGMRGEMTPLNSEDFKSIRQQAMTLLAARKAAR